MTGDMTLMLATFGVVSSIIVAAGLLLGSRKERVETRLAEATVARHSTFGRDSTSSPSRSTLPRVGALLMPQNEGKKSRLKDRLMQAGLYRRHSTAFYLGVKFLLMVTPMAVGLALGSLGLMSLRQGVLFGAIVGLVGTVTPGLWLGRLKSERQKHVRRALPDALDVIVVCLEGGLSLPAALARVASELNTAHPLLAAEMAIVRQEIQLGLSTGQALRNFANRFDVEALRSMASVVMQAERFGASVVKALRVHADTLRLKRHQHAEAQAQKAPLKLIFPTVLCIFPALYIVLMAPAGVQVFDMLKNLARP